MFSASWPSELSKLSPELPGTAPAPELPGKPHVRWCGRADGRNPVSPTRSVMAIIEFVIEPGSISLISAPLLLSQRIGGKSLSCSRDIDS
jgi:hypothetical protein